MSAAIPSLSVIDLVDKWAKLTPLGTAAEWRGETLSYIQLQHASFQVASVLLNEGIASGSRVPLLTQLSLEMLPSIIGILRAGACYVPMDTVAWSSDRLSSALHSVGSRKVLTTGGFRLEGFDVIHFQDAWMGSQGPKVPEGNLQRLKDIRSSIDPEDLAYVIFTSGTTGKPKGVMVPHRAILNLVLLQEGDVMKVSPSKRLLLMFSIGFDGCAGIVWTTLSNGGTLVMASSSDYPVISSTCHTLILTPSILASLRPSKLYDGVTEVYLGGEAPSPAVVTQWITPTRKVFNSYGPSEATVAITVCEMRSNEEPVLGKVIPGVKILLLDDKLEPSDVGEIFITGPCLALGYINDPELTSSRFITLDGERYYRTGDRAKESPRGLVWAGRVDRLIKNRGFLVNLESEVEPAMLKFPGVKAATAFQWGKKLVGCFSPGHIALDDLRAFLQDKFDHFVVPDILLAKETLPLTSNGKVDWTGMREDLDRQLKEDLLDGKYNKTASVLQAVRIGCAKSLQIPLASVTERSSFSLLGGNSLAAVQFFHCLRTHGYTIPVGQVIILDRVDKIAAAAQQIHQDDDVEMSRATLLPDSRMTPMQVRMLKESISYPEENCIMLKLTYRGKEAEVPSDAKMHDSWTKVLKRHDIFRTTFDLQLWEQRSSDDLELVWEKTVVDETGYDQAIASQESSMWQSLKRRELHYPYNRMHLITVPGRKATILWQLHHALTDGWSTRILLNEFDQIIAGEEPGQSPSYTDYARYLRNLHSREYESSLTFWRALFENVPSMPHIAIKESLVSEEAGIGVVIPRVDISRNALEGVSRRFSVSSAAILYAAWAMVLSGLSHHTTVSFRLSLSGRMLPYEYSEVLVGPMNTRPPIVVALDHSREKCDFLRSVHQTLYKVSDHQWSSTSVIQDLLGQEGAKHFQTSMVVFLDVANMSSTWAVEENQPLSVPLSWIVVYDEQILKLKLRYDMGLFSRSAVQGIAESYTLALAALMRGDTHETLQSACGDCYKALQDCD